MTRRPVDLNASDQSPNGGNELTPDEGVDALNSRNSLQLWLRRVPSKDFTPSLRPGMRTMATEDFPFAPEDRELLARLKELTDAEAMMPAHVSQAAKSLHDWSGIDALLAELVAEPVPTRDGGTALAYALGTASVRAEIEPAGYRRRRLVIVADEQGEPAAGVTVQSGDGTLLAAPVDRFGEHTVEVAAGPVRVIAQFGKARIATPWFTL